MKKFCIVCGTENFSRSKNFCCEKCHQQYYYQKNKEKLLEKHNEYYQDNKEKYKEYMSKWRKNNRERYNELALKSYYRRKEKQ